MRRCDFWEMMTLSHRLTRKESEMFYMQEKLVESIQLDRRREAEATRLAASSDTSAAPRGRLFAMPSVLAHGITRVRSTVSRTAMTMDELA